MSTRRIGLRMAPVLIGLLGVGAPLTAQSHGHDRAGVERAALDYLEGFYEGSTEKIERGVHPEVQKFGFSRESPDQAYERSPMSFQQMLEFARNVKESGRFPGGDAPKQVEVLDVLDQTAVAKVYAWWGSDYLTMARYEGEWKIVQVLWQSPPEER
ncbi:MAG: nuclear transport factor 2 family protein [Longimicrobiales bacterium]